MNHTPSQMPDEIYVCNEPDGPDLNDVCGAALYKAVELEHNGWLHQTKYTRAESVPSDMASYWRERTIDYAISQYPDDKQDELAVIAKDVFDYLMANRALITPDQSETIKALKEALYDAIEDMDLMLNHYHPSGRHEGDLSSTRELLPKLRQVVALAEKGGV